MTSFRAEGIVFHPLLLWSLITGFIIELIARSCLALKFDPNQPPSLRRVLPQSDASKPAHTWIRLIFPGLPG